MWSWLVYVLQREEDCFCSLVLMYNSSLKFPPPSVPNPSQRHRTMGFPADGYQQAFFLPTNEHCSESPLAPDRPELHQADAIPAEEELCQLAAWTRIRDPGAPSQVPNPGCMLSQGHSGSITVRPRKESALSCHVLWDGGHLLAPQGIISGKREHCLQACWLLSHLAAVHIWSKQSETIYFHTVLAKECV